MRTTREIIAAFGGLEAVAKLTDARPRTVEQWSRIGVPFKHWPLLVARAKRRGIPGITFEALYAAKAATLRRDDRP